MVNMKKNIIKNCPCCVSDMFSKEDTYFCYHPKLSVGGLCQNYSNCSLKQIVDKCKNRLNFLDYGISEQPLTMVMITELFAKAEVAQDILNLLEIEEVNE